jgi:cytochrome c biogenesis protein
MMRLLRSIRLAVVLILILTALSLAGILLPQVPAEFSVSREGYSWWLDNAAYGSFGGFAAVLGFLGLFNVFKSPAFLITIFLLLLNILACSLSRYHSIKSGTAQVKARADTDFYLAGNHHASFVSPFSISAVEEKLRIIMKKHHYSIMKSDGTNAVFIAGDKNRHMAYGTYFIHLSLFVFIFGILLGSMLGFRNSSFVIMEGTEKEVGYGTNLSMYLKSFSDAYWQDGTPKDYRSEVSLRKNGQEVKTGVISVNHPLVFKGIRFHQGFFGTAVELKITDSNGKSVFDGKMALDRMNTTDSYQRPTGNLQLADNGLSVVILKRAVNGNDPFIGENDIGVELYDKEMNFISWAKLEKNIPQLIETLNFSYIGESRFSGLLVSKDPGIILIWIASFLFLLGLVQIFYFPHRQIWVSLLPVPSEGTEISARMESRKEFGLDHDFSAMTSEWKDVLADKGRR